MKEGREAGLLRSKFDDDCIWMIRNAPYLSCPNWEDRRKSLTHIFTFRGRAAVKQHVLLFLHTNFCIIECIALFSEAFLPRARAQKHKSLSSKDNL